MLTLLAMSVLVMVTGFFFQMVVRVYMHKQRLLSIPGPRYSVINGFVSMFRSRIGRVIQYKVELAAKYGKTFVLLPDLTFQSGHIITSDARNVKHMLKDNVNNYVKIPRFKTFFREILGNGIFQLDHVGPERSEWHFHRKTMSRMFTARRFKVYAETVFQKHALKLISLLEDKCPSGPLDLQKLLFRFTFDSIGEIGMGLDLDSLSLDFEPISNAFDETHRLVVTRILHPWELYFPQLFANERAISRHSEVMDTGIMELISRRLEESQEIIAGKSDCVSLFIQDFHNKGIKPDMSLLLSISKTVMIAGRDTTASSLSWTFLLLAQHPEIFSKLKSELKLQLKGKNPSISDFPNLPYLDAVIYESLRLFPPVPADSKFSVNDDYFPDGTFVPAGTAVQFFPFGMGRDPDTWSEPTVFSPERWIAMDKKPSQYEFPVFQAGPRICLGMNMAVIEAKIAISMIVQRFDISMEYVDLSVPLQAVGATMSLKEGLWVTLSPCTK